MVPRLQDAAEPLDREAHVWQTSLDEGRARRQPSSERALLSPEELHRLERLRTDRQREVFVAAHALVRRCLSTYAPVAPAAWRFRTSPQGKPEIAGPIETTLRFNLSHCADRAACVVTAGIDCGIDVERIHRAARRVELADRLLSAQEAKALARLPQAAQARAFFVHWTLKEAYLKARGIGIGVELHWVRFAVAADGTIRPSFEPELGDREEAWQFWSQAPTVGHAMSVALQVGDEPRHIVVCSTTG